MGLVEFGNVSYKLTRREDSGFIYIIKVTIQFVKFLYLIDSCAEDLRRRKEPRLSS